MGWWGPKLDPIHGFHQVGIYGIDAGGSPNGRRIVKFTIE